MNSLYIMKAYIKYASKCAVSLHILGMGFCCFLFAISSTLLSESPIIERKQMTRQDLKLLCILHLYYNVLLLLQLML